jgi:hypothetical protein
MSLNVVPERITKGFTFRNIFNWKTMSRLGKFAIGIYIGGAFVSIIFNTGEIEVPISQLYYLVQ